MKTFVTLFAAATLTIGAQASENSLFDRLVTHLAELQDYSSLATYEVLLPTADEPVTYTIKVASSTNVADSLAAADYLIDWKLDANGRVSEGFTAYFDGNHYRFRDQRLQEFHFDKPEDAPNLAPGGDANLGLQNQAQFCDLLPQYISRKLKAMESDSTYKYTFIHDTIINGQKAVAIEGERSFGGVVALNFIYILDRDYLPVRSELTSNPGQIGEQVIITSYDYGDDNMPSVATTENELAKRYPDAFGRYRESNFSLDNLPGRRLPAFSAPSLNGERFIHGKDSEFTNTTIIALLDADDESSVKTIDGLRQAIDSLSEQVTLIFAFVSNNAAKIEPLIGKQRRGEQVLMSARGLARECKVDRTPVILICDSEGVVKDLQKVVNNDVADFVIKAIGLFN